MRDSLQLLPPEKTQIADGDPEQAFHLHELQDETSAHHEAMPAMGQTSSDVKVRAMALVIFAREKANELAKASGELVRAYVVH